MSYITLEVDDDASDEDIKDKTNDISLVEIIKNYLKKKYKIDINYQALDVVKNYFN